ncbi:hypothetical protein P5763_07405 [Bacillus cereus]|uniref:hypothetical protein n=1 Tax=Bacillus cereus TaxID=1396 RepID=UPI002405CEC1|nr:hypothetical protein [Bacillus cereus]MDF9611898.1 hypothetical protein [Bacillus cereus]
MSIKGQDMYSMLPEETIVTGHFQGGKQMSIYDFLPDGESQEVAPSETLPQVDEAQDEDRYYVLDSKGNTVEIFPSSDLDADKLITDNLVFNPEGYSEKVIELDTVEVTDKTLISAEPKFEVNQVVTVLNPYSENHEDFHILEQYKSQERRVVGISVSKGKNIYETVLPHTQDSPHYFYEHELK